MTEEQKQLLQELRENFEEGIKIGKFTIHEDSNNNENMVWITQDGEGTQFEKRKLEPIIEKFYYDNF